MFISFEGIDGAGKTTQINLLEQYFLENGKEVVKLREPGGTKFSENIREILLSHEYKLNSFTELMLFQAARSYLTENIIIPALQSNKVVLCDRFFDSTTAYQGYGRGVDIEFIDKCNFFASLGLFPTITFYLSLTLEESNQRSQNKNFDRIEASGNGFYKNVQHGFEVLSQLHPGRIKKVDANQEIEKIHKEILSYISKMN